MADYRDLLRRAIEALPENNGNARRQVYDKARAALRKQLDAIQPDLPSREKTHHRLQLEECIREVEQEATERMLSGLSQLDDGSFGSHRDEAPADRPEPATEAVQPPVAEKQGTFTQSASESETLSEAEPATAVSVETAPGEAKPEPVLASASAGALEPAEPEIPVAIEETPAEDPSSDLDQVKAVLAAAEAKSASAKPAFEPIPKQEPVPESPVSTPGADETEDEPVPQAETPPAPKSAPPGSPSPEPPQMAASSAVVEAAADEPEAEAGDSEAEPPRIDPDDEAASATPEPRKSSSFFSGLGKKQKDKPVTDATAMSAEREVELDADAEKTETDPQTAIDHAIAVLDREAGGKGAMDDPTIETVDPEMADVGFARAEAEDEGGGSPALTIFLVLVLLLLAGAGGASYWAWREGYLDLGNLFGGDTVAVSEATTPAATDTVPTTPATPALEETPVIDAVSEAGEESRPGNTAAMPDIVETPETGLEQTDDTSSDALALAPTDAGTVPAATMDGTELGEGLGNTAPSNAGDAAAAAANVAEPGAADDKTDERLPVAEDAAAAPADTTENVATVPDVVTEGSQSLLLEASDQANAGAVPFSGTVDWTRGVDELGQPTLEAKADIPARNMSMSLLIRKNSDASLPASHLVEIDFTVSDSFIGGGISRIAGILMKNEELVQGVPLIGASARVVGNSFLFALSASSQDVTANNALLKSRKWMDLAIIYSTGKQALLTLEKDDAATALFDQVIAAWSPSDTAAGNTSG